MSVELRLDSSASADYCVLVHHAYVGRVQRALGGSVAGNLEPSHLYDAIIGSCSPASLMAMGRKEISRALFVPHAATTFDEAIAAICSALPGVAALATAADPAATLSRLPLLRIDTVPKAGFGDATSAAMLAAAAAGGGGGGDALELTRSASKAVLVVNLVRVTDADFRWGIVDARAAQAFGQQLNHHAAKEAQVQSMEEDNEPVHGAVTGAVTGAVINAPVSRAFWKLQQLIVEHLAAPGSFGQQHGKWWDAVVAARGCGLDLGSSPGGWTQALRGGGPGTLSPSGLAATPRCLSFDKGPMASRVLRLGGVTHAALDFTCLEAAQAIATAGPFSCVVCDANAFNPPGCVEDGLETIISILSHAAAARGCGVQELLTSPCCFVLTLKFAYKSESSVGRNLALFLKGGDATGCDVAGREGVQPKLGVQAKLRRLAGLAEGDADIDYFVTHLMANGEAERTLCANIGTSSLGARDASY